MAGYGDDRGFDAWLAGYGYTLPAGAAAQAILRQRGSAYIDGTYEDRFPGTPTDGAAQDRVWPRTAATDRFGNGLASDAVPARVIEASYTAAYLKATKPGILATTYTPGTNKVLTKVDKIEWEVIGKADGQKAYRGRVTPEAPETPVSGFPKLGGRDSEQVALILRRLRELGYVEIGNVDGDFGDLTAKAILAFRHNNGLPLGTSVDSSLTVALNKAQPQQMPEARSDATPKEVRQKVPETRQSFVAKIAAMIGMLISGLISAVKFFLDTFTAARDTVKPIADLVGSVPLWLWALLIGGGLLTIYLKTRASEANTVAALQGTPMRPAYWRMSFPA